MYRSQHARLLWFERFDAYSEKNSIAASYPTRLAYQSGIQRRLMKAILDYMKVELPRLRERYCWEIPLIEGFPQSGESSYQANLALKSFLHRQWKAADTTPQKLELASLVISTWGGVRANQQKTLEAYIKEIEQPDPATPLKGVASYSKLFAIAHPDRYAIYDARVSACLNAIQYQAHPNAGLAFNYCPGRNNIIGNSTTRTGFTNMKEFKVQTLVEKGWTRIPRDKTYAAYLELLAKCSSAFPDNERSDFEMILFANAAMECRKAISKIT